MEGTADTQTIPLALLADAWHTDQEVLANQLGDAVITDALRIKHVRVQDACKLLEQRDAEAARHRAADEARKAQAAQEFAAQQARLQAIQRHQALVRATDPGLDAYSTMLAGDPDSSGRQGAAARAFDEVFAAQKRGDIGVFTRISPPPQEETP
jgi:hypothetical protein